MRPLILVGPVGCETLSTETDTAFRITRHDGGDQVIVAITDDAAHEMASECPAGTLDAAQQLAAHMGQSYLFARAICVVRGGGR